MSIGQNIRNERILSSSCVLIIDITGVSHNLGFIFRNITVGTFHHGKNISNSGLKIIMGPSRWVLSMTPQQLYHYIIICFILSYPYLFSERSAEKYLFLVPNLIFQNLRITL